MSEAELFESSQLAFANGISAYAIFWTIVGGYVAAAYFTGVHLSKSQYVIINSLFVVGATMSAIAVHGYFELGYQYMLELETVNPERSLLPGTKYNSRGSIVLNALIIIAGLKFMRDARSKVRRYEPDSA